MAKTAGRPWEQEISDVRTQTMSGVLELMIRKDKKFLKELVNDIEEFLEESSKASKEAKAKVK
jgi:hypothetical protein